MPLRAPARLQPAALLEDERAVAQRAAEHSNVQRAVRHRDRSYDAVVIGRDVPLRPGGELPEAAWAEAGGYRRVAASGHLIVLLPYRRGGAA